MVLVFVGLGLGLGLSLGLGLGLGLGLALILILKVYTSSQDKREFAKFKEQMIAKLDTGESQISEQVMSKDDPSLDNVQIRS